MSLRKITNALPFVSNFTLHNDLKIAPVLNEAKCFYKGYKKNTMHILCSLLRNSLVINKNTQIHSNFNFDINFFNLGEIFAVGSISLSLKILFYFKTASRWHK